MPFGFEDGSPKLTKDKDRVMHHDIPKVSEMGKKGYTMASYDNE